MESLEPFRRRTSMVPALKSMSLHERSQSSGAVLDVRFAAGNRDPEHFSCPNDIGLARRNAASHLGFSSGTHYYVAPRPFKGTQVLWGYGHPTETSPSVAPMSPALPG